MKILKVVGVVFSPVKKANSYHHPIISFLGVESGMQKASPTMKSGCTAPGDRALSPSSCGPPPEWPQWTGEKILRLKLCRQPIINVFQKYVLMRVFFKRKPSNKEKNNEDNKSAFNWIADRVAPVCLRVRPRRQPGPRRGRVTMGTPFSSPVSCDSCQCEIRDTRELQTDPWKTIFTHFSSKRTTKAC